MPAFTALSAQGVPLISMEADSPRGIATNITPGPGWQGMDKDARELIGRFPSDATCEAIVERMGVAAYLVEGKSSGEEAAVKERLRESARAMAKTARADAMGEAGNLKGSASARWR